MEMSVFAFNCETFTNEDILYLKSIACCGIPEIILDVIQSLGISPDIDVFLLSKLYLTGNLQTLAKIPFITTDNEDNDSNFFRFFSRFFTFFSPF